MEATLVSSGLTVGRGAISHRRGHHRRHGHGLVRVEPVRVAVRAQVIRQVLQKVHLNGVDVVEGHHKV